MSFSKSTKGHQFQSIEHEKVSTYFVTPLASFTFPNFQVSHFHFHYFSYTLHTYCCVHQESPKGTPSLVTQEFPIKGAIEFLFSTIFLFSSIHSVSFVLFRCFLRFLLLSFHSDIRYIVNFVGLIIKQLLHQFTSSHVSENRLSREEKERISFLWSKSKATKKEKFIFFFSVFCFICLFLVKIPHR